MNDLNSLWCSYLFQFSCRIWSNLDKTFLLLIFVIATYLQLESLFPLVIMTHLLMIVGMGNIRLACNGMMKWLLSEIISSLLRFLTDSYPIERLMKTGNCNRCETFFSEKQRQIWFVLWKLALYVRIRRFNIVRIDILPVHISQWNFKNDVHHRHERNNFITIIKSMW